MRYPVQCHFALARLDYARFPGQEQWLLPPNEDMVIGSRISYGVRDIHTKDGRNLTK